MRHLPLLPNLSNIYQAFVQYLQRSLLLWVVLVGSLMLSGCVRYNVGIQFDHANRGQITQYVQLGEQFKNFSGTTVQQWLDTIEQRSRQAGGQVEQLPNQALAISLPFSSSADLETKFNQFFDLTEAGLSGAPDTNLPEIDSHLALSHSNFLLVERQRLQYDLDLRSLGIRSANGSLLLSPNALVDLEFRLKTPWGARSIASRSTSSPEGRQTGRDLVWRLVPGERNHLEATFWLPSPLGIGTLMIVILVAVGRYLKYPQPDRPIKPSTQAATEAARTGRLP